MEPDEQIAEMQRGSRRAFIAGVAAVERMPRSMLMIRHRPRIIEIGVGEALKREGIFAPTRHR